MYRLLIVEDDKGFAVSIGKLKRKKDSKSES